MYGREPRLPVDVFNIEREPTEELSFTNYVTDLRKCLGEAHTIALILVLLLRYPPSPGHVIHFRFALLIGRIC